MANVTKPIALDETLQNTNTALSSLGKDTTLQAIATAIANVGLSNIGNMSSIATTDKTSLVSAINEVVGDVSDLDTDKADKVASAANGNLAGLNASGNLTDSGWASDKTTTSASGNPISITGLKSNQLAVNPVITFEPIQAGSGDPSPSNVRAISGYDKIEVLSCGKNLFDNANLEAGAIDPSTGGNTTQADRWRSKNHIPVVPNKKYTLSVNGTATNANFMFYKIDKTYIGYDFGSTITIPSDAYYLRFYGGSALNVSPGVQLEYGETPTTYEPYHKTTDLSENLPQTVYGGSWTVKAGKLTSTLKALDMANMDWQIAGSIFYCRVSDIAQASTLYCSCYKSTKDVISEDYTVSSRYGYYVANPAVILKDSRYNDVTSLKAALTGQVLLYATTSPIEIQLTPHEISLLKDYAYVSTNGTSIALDYHNGEIATLGDVSQLGETVNELGDIVGKLIIEPYGFIEHMSILDPAQRIEYIGKNKNYKPMTINLTGNHLANYNEWYDFPVIKENKPYMIKADGTVDYALDPNDYTKKFDGSASDVANTSYTGGAFAWISKTYKREFVVGDDRYVYISTKKLSDEYEAVGFIDENGLEHDGAWIPMFYGTEITQDGTVKIMSLATGAPTKNRNTDTQKTYLTNANPDTLFFGGAIVKVLTDIMIMLGKNSDVQAVFGTGNMNGGSGAQYMKNNACINGGAFYGTTVNNVLNKAFHSLVLLTQNQWQRDPYTLNIQGEYIVSPYYKYDLTGDSYVKTGVFVTPPSSNNWVYPNKSVSVPHWGAEPVGPYSGSTTTGWADGQYTLANQLTDTMVCVVPRFAACSSGRTGGLRAVNLPRDASSTDWNIGASPLLLSKGTNVR